MRLVLLLCLALSLQAQTIDLRKRWIEEVHTLALTSHYLQALHYCQNLKNNYNDSASIAMRYYLELSVRAMKALDHMEKGSDPKLQSLLTNGEAFFNSTSRSSTSEVAQLHHFWDISVASLLAYQGRYTRAYKKGSEALKALENASSFYDQEARYYRASWVYAQHVAHARSGGVLFWLDEKSEQGYISMKRVVLSNSSLSLAAQLSLIDFARVRGDIATAEKTLQQLQAGPLAHGRYLLWAQLRLKQSQKRTTEVAQLYFSLAQSYEKSSLFHPALYCLHESTCYFKGSTPQQVNTFARTQFNSASLSQEDQRLYKKILNTLENNNGKN